MILTDAACIRSDWPPCEPLCRYIPREGGGGGGGEGGGKGGVRRVIGWGERGRAVVSECAWGGDEER